MYFLPETPPDKRSETFIFSGSGGFSGKNQLTAARCALCVLCTTATQQLRCYLHQASLLSASLCFVGVGVIVCRNLNQASLIPLVRERINVNGNEKMLLLAILLIYIIYKMYYLLYFYSKIKLN